MFYNPWKFIIKKERKYGSEYVKVLEEELLFAIVFKYKTPLEERLIELSHDVEDLMELMDLIIVPWEIEIEKNGCLRVFNL